MNVVINTTADFTGDWQALKRQLNDKARSLIPGLEHATVIDDDFMTFEFDGFPHHPVETTTPTKINVRLRYCLPFSVPVGP
jgi:hypothetical protein